MSMVLVGDLLVMAVAKQRGDLEMSADLDSGSGSGLARAAVS